MAKKLINDNCAQHLAFNDIFPKTAYVGKYAYVGTSHTANRACIQVFGEINAQDTLKKNIAN